MLASDDKMFRPICTYFFICLISFHKRIAVSVICFSLNGFKPVDTIWYFYIDHILSRSIFFGICLKASLGCCEFFPFQRSICHAKSPITYYVTIIPSRRGWWFQEKGILVLEMYQLQQFKLMYVRILGR